MTTKGIKFSTETKLKMSLAHKGSHKSEETKLKMSLAQLGKPKSEDHAQKCRIAALGKNQKEKNGRWQGNNIKYTGLHKWIRKYKPKPINGKCQICDTEDWKDAANVTGIYNRDFSNWKFLCRKCHIYLDGTINNLKLRWKRKELGLL